MERSPYSEIDYRLLVLLSRARDSLIKARGLELDQFAVSPIEAFLLLLITDLGDRPTPADLSRRSFRDHTTISALLRRMESKGLVSRAKDTKTNTWKISLTKDGKTAAANANKMDSVHTVMSALSEADKRNLESYLKTLYENALRQIVSEPLLKRYAAREPDEIPWTRISP